MTASIIDGTGLARQIKEAVVPRVAEVVKARGRPPRLVALSSARTHEAKAYVQGTIKACAAVGIEASADELSPSIGQEELLRLLRRVQADAKTDAVIVDMPLPAGIDAEAVSGAVAPSRDAEGVSWASLGRLFAARTYAQIRERAIPVPCTALAIAELLRAGGEALAGKRAVVVGRSTIVGKPAAHLLCALDLTVTLCHSKTSGLERELSQADVVVACMGRPRFIKGEWLKPGAIVIDAGTNDEDGKLVGDVDFESAKERAGAITPVPGGVGPVTTALLLSNIVALAEGRRS